MNVGEFTGIVSTLPAQSTLSFQNAARVKSCMRKEEFVAAYFLQNVSGSNVLLRIHPPVKNVNIQKWGSENVNVQYIPVKEMNVHFLHSPTALSVNLSNTTMILVGVYLLSVLQIALLLTKNIAMKNVRIGFLVRISVTVQQKAAANGDHAPLYQNQYAMNVMSLLELLLVIVAVIDGNVKRNAVQIIRHQIALNAINQNLKMINVNAPNQFAS